MPDQTDTPTTSITQSPLSSEYAKKPIQNLDPIVDEGIGFSYLCRFGYKTGVSPVPKFLQSFLRTNVWPKLINEPKINGIFMDRLFLWITLHLPFWVYLLVAADFKNHPVINGALSVLYLAMWFDQFVSYILALHCVVHRPIFKTSNPAGRALKWFFIWIIGPMMGETPETYGAHHIAMHHPTNNGYEDLSTTMTYRRDSKWDFARYLARFFVVHGELWNYLSVRNPIVAKRFVMGELCWFAVGATLYYFRPFPCALFYVTPIVALRIGMTCGNWGQHAFLNDKNPFINTNQSCTMINTAYNTVAFNDGYHIQHHEYPIAPYYDLPLLFIKDLPAMAENDSVVFDARGGFGALFDWVSIWFLLMTGNYETLAEYFVDVRALHDPAKYKPRSKEEIVAMLKERTWKIYDEKTTPAPSKK